MTDDPRDTGEIVDGVPRAEPADDPWAAPRVVSGRYALERELGSGAMGRVYLARDRLLKRQVALKVLRRDLAENRDTVRRFLREVALAHTVTHPNVVRIYDTGEEDGLPFFTMEFLQGQGLDELIEGPDAGRVGPGGERLSIREIREISFDVLDAMEAAHRAGVVHRDLKPGNVMLTHRGAIVMDFGVAGIEEMPDRARNPPQTANLRSLVRTEAGTIFGSPAYMAPELWEGAPATVQTDLYGFGAMLYQMLTGRLPYDAKTPAAFLDKLHTSHPTPIRAYRKDTPWNLVLLVRRCMAKDPDERPPSARAAANLISPLRGRSLRRIAALVGVAAVATVAAVTYPRATSWAVFGLEDSVAQADLGAAIRSYDVGDRTIALRQLQRLADQTPHAAAVAFWRATIHHEQGDERGRRDACEAGAWAGSEDWIELATHACAEAYSLAPPMLGTLERSAGALGEEFLPLAIDGSLIPRLEAARDSEAPVFSEAGTVAARLGKEPKWGRAPILPVRWGATQVHLAISQGDLDGANRQLAALRDRFGPVPLVSETDGWLALQLGDLERARDLARELANTDPTLSVRLMLEEGRLEAAWERIAGLGQTPTAAGLRRMWCGYAFRFEIPTLPRQCAELEPGLIRSLWLVASGHDADTSALSSLEQIIVRRQRELIRGECRPGNGPTPILTHATAPFELYYAQQEITAAVCAADPARADLERARGQVADLVATAPSDPWSLLVQSAVDDASGSDNVAHARRLDVSSRWAEADPELPLVRRLHQNVSPAPASTRAVAGTPRAEGGAP